MHKLTRRTLVGLLAGTALMGAGPAFAQDGGYTIGVSNTVQGNGWREEMICSIKAQALVSGQVESLNIAHRNTDAAGQLEDAVRRVVGGGLVRIVLGRSLGMEGGQQTTGLSVGVRVPRSLREVLHQEPRQVLHGQDAGLRRGLQQGADGAGLQPGPSPVSTGVDLAQNVVIAAATRLDDEVLILMADLQHHGVDQTPTVVRNYLVAGEPAGKNSLLVRCQGVRHGLQAYALST